MKHFCKQIRHAWRRIHVAFSELTTTSKYQKRRAFRNVCRSSELIRLLTLLIAIAITALFLIWPAVTSVQAAVTEEIVSITETVSKDVNSNPNNTNYIIEVNGLGKAGPNTAIHSTTSYAANDDSKVEHYVNPIYGMNNLSLGIFTSAGYALAKNASGDYFVEDIGDGKKDFYGNLFSGTLGYTIDPTQQQYNYATAFGERTAAANTLATAFGRYSVAAGKGSTAFGYYSRAKGDYSLAFGGDGSNPASSNTASGPYSVAFGYGTSADKMGTTAFGYINKAGGLYSTAFGYMNKAAGPYATAFGSQTTASGYEATSFGSSTQAIGDNSVAFGDSSAASGYAATALGYGTTASNEQAVALGDSTTASGINSIATGYKTSASNYQAVALGNGTTASGVNSIAAGYQTTASNFHAVALGYQSTASGIVSIAAGVQTTASGGSSIAAGYLSKARGYAATALGNNTTASGDQAVTLGSETTAGGINSIAAGNKSSASGYAAVALGQATASGKYSTATGYTSIASGAAATALGYGTTASGDSSLAAGYNSVASGKITTALGDSSVANGVNSLAALGGITAVSADNSAAIGKGAQTKLTGTVALGDSSLADTASGRVGYLKTSTDVGAAWVSTRNAISVGDASSDITRQITGVAAGTEDTDAVNVAQLKSITKSLSNLSNITMDYVSADNFGTMSAAVASGQNSAALGYGSTASGTSSTALGTGSQATGGNSTAIGSNAQATTANSVALGANSTTGPSVEANANTFEINGVTYTSGTGLGKVAANTTGVVSIGNASETRQLQNVANGQVTKDSTDAINGSQLYALVSTLTPADDGSYIKSNDTVGNNLTALDMGLKKVSGIAGIVGSETISGSTNVTIGGDNVSIKSNVLSNDTTAQAKQTLENINNVNNLTGSEKTKAENDAQKVATGSDIAKIQKMGLTIATNAGKGDNAKTVLSSTKAAGDQEAKVVTSLGTTLAIKGAEENNDAGTTYEGQAEYSASNIKTFVSTTADQTTVRVAMKKDADFDSISVGGKTYINSDGLNANNNPVTNVGSAGTISAANTNAVNGADLYNYVGSYIGSTYNYLDTEISEVGANAAALSGLHPLEYDPEYKWDITAAYGGYRSESSLALGAFYHPNENMLFNIATTLGNSDNMYRFGVSMRLGPKPDHVSITGREAQAKQISALQEENKNLSQKVDEQAGQINKLTEQNRNLNEKLDAVLKLVKDKK